MAQGKPSFEIKKNEHPPLYGFYFILNDSEGNGRMESNAFDDKDLCRQGAEAELKNWIDAGRIS